MRLCFTRYLVTGQHFKFVDCAVALFACRRSTDRSLRAFFPKLHTQATPVSWRIGWIVKFMRSKVKATQRNFGQPRPTIDLVFLSVCLSVSNFTWKLLNKTSRRLYQIIKYVSVDRKELSKCWKSFVSEWRSRNFLNIARWTFSTIWLTTLEKLIASSWIFFIRNVSLDKEVPTKFWPSSTYRIPSPDPKWVRIRSRDHGRRSRGGGQRGQVPSEFGAGGFPPDFVMLQYFKHQITCITM